MPSSGDSRRVRVERGIYRQTNGRYAVCVMVEARPRFRTIDAGSLPEARRQRELLQSIARIGELPLSPRLTFAEMAERWLAEFEAKVIAGERRDRTLDLYRSQLHRHLLPRLGRRRLALITADDVVAVMSELRADGLSPWTIKRILGAERSVDAGPDSVNVLPSLLGSAKKPVRDSLILQNYNGNGLALRKGVWKFIPGAGPKAKAGGPQLYDLKNDIGETTNLAGEKPEKVAEMREVLQGIRQGEKSRK